LQRKFLSITFRLGLQYSQSYTISTRLVLEGLAVTSRSTHYNSAAL